VEMLSLYIHLGVDILNVLYVIKNPNNPFNPT